MPGVRITDLPLDNSKISNADTFIKVNGDTTYKVNGDTFVKQFSGITDAASLGDGIPIFSSLSPDRTKLIFNTILEGFGIDLIQGSNTLTIQLQAGAFITRNMIAPGTIDASLCAPGLISADIIQPNSIGYSELKGGDSTEAVQDRIADAWVNFNGARVTSGTGYAPEVRTAGFGDVAGNAGDQTIEINCPNHGIATGNTVNLSNIQYFAGAVVTVPTNKILQNRVYVQQYQTFNNSQVFVAGNYIATKINNNLFRVTVPRKVYGTSSGNVTVKKAVGAQANGVSGDQISLTAGSPNGQWQASIGTIKWAATDVGVTFYISAPGIYNQEPIRITSVNTANNTAQFTLLNGNAAVSRVLTGNAYTFNSFGIRSCFNVDGISKLGTGQWKVSFRHDRSDNLYAAVGNCNDPSTTPDTAILSVNSQANTDVTITATRVSPPAKNAVTSGYVDSTNISLVVFGI
jgi:hypothetical protein